MPPIMCSWITLLLFSLVDLVKTLPAPVSSSHSTSIGELVQASAGRDTASVPVEWLGGAPYWSVNASVNGQTVRLMLDTGSSDLYVRHSLYEI